MLVNDFLTRKDVLSEKYLLEKDATINRFEYSPSGSELKKQTGIAKDQYKFFKYKMNVISNNNTKDVNKKEDVEINEVDHGYNGDEYKDLIDSICKSRLKDGKLSLTNIVNSYLEKKILMWMIDCLILRNP